MRAQNRIREFPRRANGSLESLLSRFSASLRELKPSLGLSGFVERFADRAVDLFGAKAGLVLLLNGKEPVFAAAAGSAQSIHRTEIQRLTRSLATYTGASAGPVARISAVKLLGRALSQELGWKEIVLVSLVGGTRELLGLLCLADLATIPSDAECHLLEALAGHAAVALENARLISRIEHSRKNWVEDFDAITDFIVVHSADNVILRVNRSLANFLGVPLTELLGRSMEVLRPLSPRGKSLPCPFCWSRNAREQDAIHTAMERTYLVSTSRLRGSFEEEQRTIHVLKDITDRQELERRYRELFDNIQEGLFFCTPEGKFIEVNQALVRMLGYSSREELAGLNLFEDLCLRPDRREEYLEQFDRHDVLRDYEEILRRQDGSIMYTLQNLLAVRDATGSIVQYRGLMLDITGQKTFQAQLQRERDFNKNILNNTQSMILVLDTAGLVSYLNRRCLEAGYREETLLGRPLVELVPAGQRRLMSEALERALNGAPVDSLELPIRRDDGRAGQFSVSLSPMRDEQGSINSIVVVMTDITDAADLQAQLMHAEKMAAVGQLVSGVAHEVNNPLAAIVGFTDLLLENSTVPAGAKEELRVILQEAQRTKRIVQNLLSFARQTPARREAVQVNEIVRQTLELRAYDFASKGVEIVEKLDANLPDVLGDSQQFQQVFLNILNNAFDAVEEAGGPGRIEIETAQREGCVEIAFRDNGPGIAQPDRVFEPFFTTKEVGRGTGLGLSICYGIVRAHRGEILCQSNSNGPGATFVVRLPMERVAAGEGGGK